MSQIYIFRLNYMYNHVLVSRFLTMVMSDTLCNVGAWHSCQCPLIVGNNNVITQGQFTFSPWGLVAWKKQLKVAEKKSGAYKITIITDNRCRMGGDYEHKYWPRRRLANSSFLCPHMNNRRWIIVLSWTMLGGCPELDIAMLLNAQICRTNIAWRLNYQ